MLPTVQKTIISNTGKMDVYYDSIKENTPDTVKIPGYNDYVRYKEFWNTRVYNCDTATGDYSKYVEQLKLYNQNPAMAPTATTSNTWEFEGPKGLTSHNQGIIVSLYIEPNNINNVLAGTNNSGLFKTTNGGQTWVNVTDIIGLPGLGVLDIAVNPNNTSEIYISTGNSFNNYGMGIFKTTDNCNSWQQVLSFDPNDRMLKRKLLIDNENPSIIYALVNKYVYRSKNGGSSWEMIFDQLTIPNWWDKNKYLIDIEFKPNDHNTLYISSVNIGSNPNPTHEYSAEIWKTHNAKATNVTWQRIENGYYDNLSYIKDSKFSIDNEYLESGWSKAQVYLWGVKGVRFAGCEFINNFNELHGHGINAYNAGFKVYSLCYSQVSPCPEEDMEKCTFDNFKKGINLGNFNSTNTIDVENAVFTNNSIGIQLSNVQNASILFSDFYIGENVAEEGDCEGEGEVISAYGINMNQCSGFAVEENNFYKYSGAPEGIYTGIYIAETQATDEVYKNYFEGLSYGNYAAGRNFKLPNKFKFGLAYYCNENTANYADFYVEPDNDPLINSGIQSLQGNDDLVAGNKFTSTGATWHFYNGGDYLVGYYFCDFCANENPDDDKEFYVTDKPENFDNDCPSHYGGGGSGAGRGLVLTPGEMQQAEQDFAANLTDYNNVKALYDNLKDGGNTEATLTDVETAWPNDMWELRAELLGKSPHLSMDVLKATADKTDIFPDNVIFEIMAANPDELKKEELIKYLEDKENPLPEYIINILRQVSEGTTYKTVLEQQMSNYNRLKTRAANDIIRSILNDSVTDLIELRSWLDNAGGKRADEQIIASYLMENNFSDAITIANMMPALYDYSDYEVAENGYYMDMLNLQILLAQEERTIFDLDSAEIDNLVAIADNSTGTAGSQAKGILEFAYGYHYCDCLDVSDSTGYKSSGIINPEDLAKVYGLDITTEPNPASEWVAFNYTLPVGNTEGVIKISDVSGKFVAAIPITGKQGQKVWDTRKIKSGVYFYILNVSGFYKSGKIVISK